MAKHEEKGRNSEMMGELSTDYHNRCGNCHEYIGDDRFCRYCGTRRGQGKYEPYLDIMQCIYGPMPIERTHMCIVCRNTYTVARMVDKEKFCPLCGGETFIIEAEGQSFPISLL